MKTLVLNSGSTSVKWAMFEDGVRRKGGTHSTAAHLDRDCVVRKVLETVGSVDAVGHRVVHGSDLFMEPTLVDETVVDDIAALIPLAPLHQHSNVEGIDACMEALDGVPQVACFDTAFHHVAPDFTRKAYALPRWLHDDGYRRYGFHGLAYESFAHAYPQGDYIVAHLGGGCSACAIQDGVSLDTSMGYSTIAGLPMATRCGDVDPGMVLALVRRYGLNRVEELLYHESGLQGLCGMSDMQEVEAACKAGDLKAAEALDVFCFRVAREISALAVNFEEPPRVAFMGGIGENSDMVRDKICALIGIEDPIVHHADEEATIDRHVRELVGA